MTARNPGARTVTARCCAPVLHPTRDSVRGLALASVIANAVLVCTGAAVRLSSSGLGCPDWPRCTQASVVAAHSAGQTSLNTAIEFGNRLLTFPLAAIAVLTFIACLSYRPGGRRRRDLVLLSAALPGGVVAQAVAGGVVVLTRLNPVMVASHFLLSSAILAAAVMLHARAAEGPGPARPLVRGDLRVLAGLLDEWAKDVAPSAELRTWYHRDPAKFGEFRQRYTAELEQPGPREALSRLRVLAAGKPVTLLTATRDLDLSQAAVLAGLLREAW